MFGKFFIFLTTLLTFIVSGVNSVSALGSDEIAMAIKGSGNIKTESKVLDMSPYSLNIDKLSFVSSPDVKIYVSPTSGIINPSISITTDENILEILDIRINEYTNKIDITSSEKISPTKFSIEIIASLKEFIGKGKFDLDITSDESLILNVNGSSIGKINLVEATNAVAKLNGSSKLNFSGTSSTFDLTAKGLCNIKADELITKNCKVGIYGNNNVSVFASESLNLLVYGGGEFRYAGNPQKFSKYINGSCKIQKFD